MAEAGKGDKAGAMRVDPSLVRELPKLLSDDALTEIEVEDGDRRIRVSRAPSPVIRFLNGRSSRADCPTCTYRASVAWQGGHRRTALRNLRQHGQIPDGRNCLSSPPSPAPNHFIEVGGRGEGGRHVADRRSDEGR